VIPFNKPYLTGNELAYIGEVTNGGQLSGDGPFTRRCHEYLVRHSGAVSALLTQSCTAALEMAAILANVGPGDEVIMPSYTFVSTANAFVLRGAIPVFVDIRSDTLNINETLIEAAITSKTRVIVPVHYAGIACEMERILDIATANKLLVIEDAAQGVMAKYKGSPLGSLGDLGAYSFHETKNVMSGEGGALLVNDSDLVERAQIIREKGTNRAQFISGQVDKYTWIDKGSSYLPSEVTAAFLLAQLEQGGTITAGRLALWQRYHHAFVDIEASGYVQRPTIPMDIEHNGHMYYLILNDSQARDRFIDAMGASGISCVFHYTPLHSSPAGQKYGKYCGTLEVTDRQALRLVRIPLWFGMDLKTQDRIIESIHYFFTQSHKKNKTL